MTRHRGGAPVPSSPRAAAASLLALVVLQTASLFTTWLSVRTGNDIDSSTALEIPVIGPLVVLLVVAGAAGIVIEGLVLGRWPLIIPSLTAAVLFAISTVFLVVEEVAANLIPTSLIPGSFEDLSFHVYGGTGVWLAVLSSAALAVASRVRGGLLRPVRRLVRGGRRLPTRWLIMLLVSGIAVGSAIWARYLPWASGTAAGEQTALPGWSLPVIGPATLIIVLSLGVCWILLIIKRNLIALLVFVTAGWALSLLGAVGLLVTRTLSKVELESLLPSAVDEYAPSVELRSGPLVTFLIGCAISLCGMGMVQLFEREKR